MVISILWRAMNHHSQMTHTSSLIFTNFVSNSCTVFFFQLFNNESEAAAPNWKFYKMNAIISNHGQYAYPQISRTLLLNIIRYWQYDIFSLQYSGADVHRVLAEIKGTGMAQIFGFSRVHHADNKILKRKGYKKHIPTLSTLLWVLLKNLTNRWSTLPLPFRLTTKEAN